jgi:hypothetical protein
MAGFALSELAEIRQQFAGICEERMGHLLWQHCMLPIAAAFPNPHAGPSWTTSTASSNTVSTLRTDMILYPFLDFGKSRDEQCRDNEERIATGIVLPLLIELAMRQKNLIPFREGVLGVACGRVLEIGIGSDLKLPSYPSGAEEVYGVDPSTQLLVKTSKCLNTARISVRLVEAIVMFSSVLDSLVQRRPGHRSKARFNKVR